jgi:hypothetical protein
MTNWQKSAAVFEITMCQNHRGMSSVAKQVAQETRESRSLVGGGDVVRSNRSPTWDLRPRDNTSPHFGVERTRLGGSDRVVANWLSGPPFPAATAGAPART